MMEQFPQLKNANLKHSEYAKKNLGDLFEKVKKGQVKPLIINYGKSILARNDGKGQFTIEELPFEVQLSCVNDISTLDVNQDGFMDVILGGNSSQMIPQFGTLDACHGKILLNNGGKTFTYNSSLGLKGETRQFLKLAEKEFLILQNNTKPLTYQFR